MGSGGPSPTTHPSTTGHPLSEGLSPPICTILRIVICPGIAEKESSRTCGNSSRDGQLDSPDGYQACSGRGYRHQPCHPAAVRSSDAHRTTFLPLCWLSCSGELRRRCMALYGMNSLVKLAAADALLWIGLACCVGALLVAFRHSFSRLQNQLLLKVPKNPRLVHLRQIIVGN